MLVRVPVDTRVRRLGGRVAGDRGVDRRASVPYQEVEAGWLIAREHRRIIPGGGWQRPSWPACDCSTYRSLQP
jgi:hypothetical protein